MKLGYYSYSYENYFNQFSRKSQKKIDTELDKLNEKGVTYRFNRLKDIDLMFRMNINNFGNQLYFQVPRFFESFQNLVILLQKKKCLWTISILINDELAAVDIGTIWGRTYTLLAGSTNSEFPGVAKLINLHYIEWAFTQNYDVIDSLCGGRIRMERTLPFNITSII